MASPQNDDVFERRDTSHHRNVELEEGLISGYIFPLAILADVANGDEAEFVAPFDFYINRVSVRAGEVTNPGDGDVTVDVLDDGASVLTAALSVGAVDTTVEEDNIEHKVEAGSVVRVAFALTGTSPALANVGITIS